MLWQIGLPALGILCIAYYAAVCILLRKWDSTFSRFWLAAGAVCLILRVIAAYHPEIADSFIWKLLWIPFLVFLVVEGMIISAMKAAAVPGLTYIIVLGAQISGRKVTDSLSRRLFCACTYLKENPDTTVIVSGGQGAGEEVPEAEVMRTFLIDAGIDEKRIICEDRSRTTRENLEFSAEYLESKEIPVGIVSNNFHIYRACGYARKLGYKDVTGIAAGCNPLLFLNYMVREFFAVLKFWLFF